MLKDNIQKFHFSPRVLGEQVSRILADAILEGTLKGGDQLVEADLQKQFGISRSPLREAFRDLEKKGLVVIAPRRGTFVKRITRKEIEETFPLRAMLEGLAARLAKIRMTEAFLEEMEAALRGMEQAGERRDPKAYWQEHLAFHDCFIQASGNDKLIGILQNLRMHSMWYRLAYRYYQDDLESALAVHRRIFEMIRSPSVAPEALGTLVQQHIEVAFERFLGYLQEQEQEIGAGSALS